MLFAYKTRYILYLATKPQLSVAVLIFRIWPCEAFFALVGENHVLIKAKRFSFGCSPHKWITMAPIAMSVGRAKPMALMWLVAIRNRA